VERLSESFFTMAMDVMTSYDKYSEVIPLLIPIDDSIHALTYTRFS
jgi:hypothetical protein